MKSSIIPLVFFAIVVSSCSTSYKTGQTPDDVYFSPTPPQDEYVSNKNKDDRKYQGEDPDSYRNYDNRYLRMKVQNRTRWSELDDWYQYDRYAISYYPSYYWNTPWNANTYWNYYYNPYCQGSVIVNPKNTTYNKPRTVNLNTFNNLLMSNNNNNNPKASGSPKINTNIYNNSNNNNNSGLGNTLRNIFNSNNNNSGNNTGSSTSGGSEKSSGSSGGSAPVRKF